MSYEAWGEPDEMPDGWVTEDQCNEIAKEQFVEGLVAMREMLARFVEQGGDAVTAASLRANWNPEWGVDPKAPTMRTHGWLGPDLHDKAQALIAEAARPTEHPPEPREVHERLGEDE